MVQSAKIGKNNFQSKNLLSARKILRRYFFEGVFVKEKFYIFFDIDGVLNSMDGWNEENFPIEMKCLKNFADTINFFKSKYEVHLIMSSSWRDGFNYEVGQHTPEVQDILNKLKKFDIEVEDKTPFLMQKNRADEINSYITEHNLQKYKLLAIDDTKHLFGSPLEKNLRLYITDAKVGFSRKDYKFLTGDGLNFFQKMIRFFKNYRF